MEHNFVDRQKVEDQVVTNVKTQEKQSKNHDHDLNAVFCCRWRSSPGSSPWCSNKFELSLCEGQETGSCPIFFWMNAT